MNDEIFDVEEAKRRWRIRKERMLKELEKEQENEGR
jgi:hypothetical protein